MKVKTGHVVSSY